MPEPQELLEARRCLARAEANLRSADGLAQLVEGLALLDDVIGAGAGCRAHRAQPCAELCDADLRARSATRSPPTRSCPSPSSSIFLRSCSRSTQSARRCRKSAQELKIEVVRRLIDRYYEGHPPEQRQRALEELAQIGRSD